LLLRVLPDRSCYLITQELKISGKGRRLDYDNPRRKFAETIDPDIKLAQITRVQAPDDVKARRRRTEYFSRVAENPTGSGNRRADPT